MSKVEDQLKLLAQETDVEENDEVENPWIDAESKLSDDEKLEKLKDLARYANSNEFKSLRRKYKDLLQLVKEEIRKKAYARTETKAEKSVLDEYVVIANTIREIAEDVTNLTFKDYLLKGRVESYDSAIINKKGNVIRGQSEMPFDMAVFTELDLLKEKVAVYNSVERFLGYLISLYDVKNLMENIKLAKKEKKAEAQDNPNQPYE